MKIVQSDYAYTFDDLMLVPVHSRVRSRKSPSTITNIKNKMYGIPIFSAPMTSVTGAEMSAFMSEAGGSSVIHRFLSIPNQINEAKKAALLGATGFYVAIGASGDFMERAGELVRNGFNNFCVDVANGHSEICCDAVHNLKKKFECTVMAGNVCTYQGTRQLVAKGADIIRVGIGPGSACKTRIVTGYGVPQLTAIQWCADIKKDVPETVIVADGGIRNSGDIAKAIAAGADFVMLGGLLAGTLQTPGELKRDSETEMYYKYYHGMASQEGRAEWFDRDASSFVPEGESMKVPYKGDAKQILNNLVGSLKVSMSFADAINLNDFRENARWVKVTDNGRREGNPNRKMFSR